MATTTIHHLFILCFLLFLSLAYASRFPVSSSDEKALRAFLSAIESDPSGVFHSWRTKSDACAWKGVKCSRVHTSREFRVVALTLPNSRLQGTLSPRLALLSELKTLDLSNNRLSGNIPEELSRLPKLRFINLSNNLLVGEIPTSGVFKRAESFRGNPGLCGFPLPKKCSSFPSIPLFISRVRDSLLGKPKSHQLQPQAPAILRRSLADSPSSAPGPAAAAAPGPSSQAQAPGPSPIETRHHKRSKLKRWAIGAGFGVLAGSISGIIVGAIGRVALIIYRNSRKSKGPTIFYHKIKPKMLAFLDAPDWFQQMELLGEGAAGKVYKASLIGSDESSGALFTVAIKRILIKPPEPESGKENSGASKKSSSFGKKHTLAEMETLGKIRHHNLAWLFAYIPKPDAHLLVYQFMSGGSLRSALLKVREGTLELDWKMRKKIAIGAVNGLKYLHFDCTPAIFHRDLKTSNILLDEDFEAHLGDFGLARALPDDKTHITTNVAGTVGYIAPEFAHSLKLTAASDVFSMGIVLGVLLSGKEPTDAFFCERPMDVWLTALVQTGQELLGIDPTLMKGSEGEGGELAMNVEEIAEMKLMMRVANLCTKAVPAERPSSKDLLAMLNPTRIELRRPFDELIQSDL